MQLSEEQRELISQISSFDIDGGAVKLSFAKRLARENQWTLSFSNRVIEEYKRFVALAMVAGRQVTPSEHVDQAWHLHLTYTVSYWERFHRLLPFPLHHHPTKGGGSESDKFENQYEATLKLYSEVFGEAPPADIWPPTESRFGHDLAWARVNLNDHWVIRKPDFSKLRLPFAAVILSLIGAGCVLATTDQAPVENPFALLIVIGVVLTLFFIVMIYRASKTERGRNGGDTSGSGSYGGSGCGGGSSHRHDNDSGSDSGGGDSGGGGCGGGCGGGD
jgi:hypothetical protein